MRFIMLLTIPIMLCCHSLKIHTSEQNNSLQIKAFFSSSSPCSNCEIQINTFDEKIIHETLDKNGKIEIPIDLNVSKIIVKADLIHKKSIYLNGFQDHEEAFSFKILLAFVSMAILFGALWYFKRFSREN